MERLLLGIALGICTALIWPELPPNWLGCAFLLIGLLLLFRYRFSGAVLCGFGWAVVFFNLQLGWLKTQHLEIPAQHELNVTVTQAYQKSDHQQLLVSAQQINQ